MSKSINFNKGNLKFESQTLQPNKKQSNIYYSCKLKGHLKPNDDNGVLKEISTIDLQNSIKKINKNNKNDPKEDFENE